MMFFAKAGLALCLLSMATVPAMAKDWDDFTPREPSLKQAGHWEWTWDGDDGLGVSVPASVHVIAGGPARISVTGSDEMLARLRIGQGRIKLCNDCRASGKLDITVSGVSLHAVALLGAGGEIALGALSQDRLNLAISGTGKVSAGGRIDRVALAISGTGDVDLGDAAVQRADIHIAGSGNVRITPHEEANIHVAGSGKVRMAKAPARLNQMVVGSGGVRVTGDANN